MRKNEEIDESTLTDSPYVRKVKINATSYTNYKQFRRSDGIMLYSEYLIEDNLSCKLYRSSDVNTIVMSLNYRALQMFNWIALHIPKDRGWIMINEAYFCKRAGITTSKTYNKALTELLEHKIIRHTHYKTVYWVNPHYLFNGNRMVKYPDNLSVKKYEKPCDEVTSEVNMPAPTIVKKEDDE